jgi:tRNA pseudouridine38-40 synthase
MTLWKLILTYDGTSYSGWQVQPGRPTVQGTLAAALAHISGETVLPQGSGRTDAGVHALAQVASFTLAAPLPPENLLRALNRALPPSIRVLSAEIAPPTFHARHSARGKTYEYRIFENHQNREICPPFLAPWVWDCHWPLALEPMQKATSALLGTHDFTSFAASDPDVTLRTATDASSRPEAVGRSGETPVFAPAHATTTAGPNPIKTITGASLTREADLLIFRITGSGFLHHMVRNLVGTLVEIGRGALAADDFVRILAARDRTLAGPTAPASGLFLVRVDYAEPQP